MREKILQKTDFEKRNGKILLFLHGHKGKIRRGKISPRFRFDEDPRYTTAINILSAHAFLLLQISRNKIFIFEKLLKTPKVPNYTSKVCRKTHPNEIRYKQKFISRNSTFLSPQIRLENPHLRHETLLTQTSIQIITRYRRIPQNVA